MPRPASLTTTRYESSETDWLVVMLQWRLERHVSGELNRGGVPGSSRELAVPCGPYHGHSCGDARFCCGDGCGRRSSDGCGRRSSDGCGRRSSNGCGRRSSDGLSFLLGAANSPLKSPCALLEATTTDRCQVQKRRWRSSPRLRRSCCVARCAHHSLSGLRWSGHRCTDRAPCRRPASSGTTPASAVGPQGSRSERRKFRTSTILREEHSHSGLILGQLEG